VSDVVPEVTRLVVCELSKNTVVAAWAGLGSNCATTTAMTIAAHWFRVHVVFTFQ